LAYVKDANKVAFEPFNLDLLRLLGELCGVLRQRVDAEKEDLETRCDELSVSIPDAGNAREVVANLTSKTTPEQIAEITKWVEDTDGTKLEEINKSLTGAAAELLALRGRQTRCTSLSARVSMIERGLTDEKAKHLQALLEDASDKRQAVNKISEEAFKNEPLGGVGGGPWQVLWKAASDYSSQVAYPDQPFPFLKGDDPRCVLCQQTIRAKAKERLLRFRNFIEGTVAQQAKVAEKALSDAREELLAIDSKGSDDDRALSEEIKPEDEQLSQAVTNFLTAAEKRMTSLLQALTTGDFSKLDPAPKPLATTLQAYIENLKQRAKKLESGLTAEERAKLEGEHAQLLGRKTLAEHKTMVKQLVNNQAAIDRLQACWTALNTLPITTTKKAMETEFLHQPFQVALQEELDALRVEQQVTLGFKAEKAVTYQKTKFQGTSFDRLDDVLSEGEHRAVALACFLSEAKQLPGNSPLVIDDPISSLDHIRRDRVAIRLVLEAKHRQVIILTHDLGFYSDIESKTAEHQVPLRKVTLVYAEEGYGHVASGEPWDVKDVGQRLHHLESELLPGLEELHKLQDPSYHMQVRGFSGLLRDTWERLVEEGMFNKAVLRFRRSVQTQRLIEVEVNDSVWAEIHWGMTRTSKWEHDSPAATGDPPPTPNDLREEIKRVRACHKSIKNGRKDIRANREGLLGSPVA
jgi:hypothetical protein